MKKSRKKKIILFQEKCMLLSPSRLMVLQLAAVRHTAMAVKCLLDEGALGFWRLRDVCSPLTIHCWVSSALDYPATVCQTLLCT